MCNKRHWKLKKHSLGKGKQPNSQKAVEEECDTQNYIKVL